MCFLVLWMNPSLKKNLSGRGFDLNVYSLIMASNRDERYDRPALPVHHWDSDASDCLGGTDATPGKEGGTWLGVSRRRRKVGVLVNIPEQNPVGTLGRGHLVSDYLKSDLYATDHVIKAGLEADAERYPGFQLITLEAPEKAGPTSGLSWNLNYWSNKAKSFTVSGTSQILAFSNSAFEKPLLKVADCSAAFESRLRDHDFEDEEDLVAEMFSVLSSDREYDDPMIREGVNLKNYGNLGPEEGEAVLRRLAAIFVRTPVFGTRTQTVLLVKKSGEAFLKEKSMKEPIDTRNPVWDEKIMRFTFDT